MRKVRPHAQYLEREGKSCADVPSIHYVRRSIANVVVEEDLQRVAIRKVQEQGLARVRPFVSAFPKRIVVVNRESSATTSLVAQEKTSLETAPRRMRTTYSRKLAIYCCSPVQS